MVRKVAFTLLFPLLLAFCAIAQDRADAAGAQAQPSQPASKALVFITDSQSWETTGAAAGGRRRWGAFSSGGARPQTAEIIKTFGERCPQTIVNNIESRADYIVVLDHEGGKGLLRHKNKVAVFARISGDSIASKSTYSLGGSVQEACDAITKDWSANGEKLRAAAMAETEKAGVSATAPEAPERSNAKLSISSVPDGADIEVDGNFMGNTPSTLELPAGSHTVVVRKSGFKMWERSVKLSGGQITLNAEMEKEVPQ